MSLNASHFARIVKLNNITIITDVTGDVLSALSRNATVIHQQQNQQQLLLSKSANSLSLRGSGVGGPGSGPSVTRNQLNLVPVPYRNSKLTHLLKGNPTTNIM